MSDQTSEPPFEPAATPEWRGAGVVIQVKNIFGINGPLFLVGKETYYASDAIPEIIPFQTIPAEEADTVEEAETIFSKRAKNFEKNPALLGLRFCSTFSFDTPRLRPEGWTTNFRQVPPEVIYGFPKGKRRRSADASPQATALRELEEETGIELRPEQLHPLSIDRDYHFFLYTISTQAEYDAAEATIKAKNARANSELQDISFTPLSEIRKDIAKFNGLSRKLLNDFFLPKPK